MLRRNQRTVDGLVNDTMGTVAGYDRPEGRHGSSHVGC